VRSTAPADCANDAKREICCCVVIIVHSRTRSRRSPRAFRDVGCMIGGATRTGGVRLAATSSVVRFGQRFGRMQMIRSLDTAFDEEPQNAIFGVSCVVSAASASHQTHNLVRHAASSMSFGGTVLVAGGMSSWFVRRLPPITPSSRPVEWTCPPLRRSLRASNAIFLFFEFLCVRGAWGGGADYERNNQLATFRAYGDLLC